MEKTMEGISGCFALVVLLAIAGVLIWYLWGRGGRDPKDTGQQTRAEHLQPHGDEPRDDPRAGPGD
jgi:ABC-type transporter Mla subunit MlaD